MEKATIIQGLHGEPTTLQSEKRSRIVITEPLKNLFQTQLPLMECQTKVNLGEVQLSVPEWSNVYYETEIRRNPPQASNEIFKIVGLPNTPKITRCHTLKSISKCPPLKCVHREKRLKWAENNMKVNFENVIFTDECRTTLDGPDGWIRGWYDEQFPSSQGTTVLLELKMVRRSLLKHTLLF